MEEIEDNIKCSCENGITISHCMECEMYFCKLCIKGHLKSEKLKTHELKQVKINSKSSITKEVKEDENSKLCLKHLIEYRYICLTDELVCMDCIRKMYWT